jgi:hypothetical protein
VKIEINKDKIIIHTSYHEILIHECGTPNETPKQPIKSDALEYDLIEVQNFDDDKPKIIKLYNNGQPVKIQGYESVTTSWLQYSVLPHSVQGNKAYFKGEIKFENLAVIEGTGLTAEKVYINPSQEVVVQGQ